MLTAPPTLRPYPFVNPWRRGCWVARPTGDDHPKFVYEREFVTGTPHRSSGMVRYSLEDLGGPGWVVACDGHARELVRVSEIGWEVVARDLRAADILAVVRAGEWDGTLCGDCGAVPITDADVGPTCWECSQERRRAANEANTPPITNPEEVPF